MNIIKFKPYYKAVFSGYLHVGSSSRGSTIPITNLTCEVDGKIFMIVTETLRLTLHIIPVFNV